MSARLRAAGLGLAAAVLSTQADDSFDYHLKAQAVADGVYVFVGKREKFSRGNGGDIVNTGFIVGHDGVIVIDTGPSKTYGEQQRAAIARVTALPVVQVFVTHAHPDHFLGDQAYPAAEIEALPGTIDTIRRDGETLSGNLYRLVGGWMLGTRVEVPGAEARAGEVTVAGRRLRVFADAGHTEADLMVLDVATKTLFAGDLVFGQQAPTTPNANLAHWFASLDAIDQIDYQTLVPGHGAIAHDRAAVTQTRDYLHWLDRQLHEAAAQGLTSEEVMRQPIPERFRGMALVDYEHGRSVSHLYPAIELQAMPEVGR